MKPFASFITLAALLAFAFVSASAQTSIYSSLSGRVTDGGGAAIAGARARLDNIETGAAQSVFTGKDGDYIFPRLERGRYTLTVEKEGFRRATREGLVVTVNEAATVNVTLEVGAITETVTVRADTAVAQSERTDLSALIDERRVRELPLNGKSFIKLIQLSPGVGSAVPGAFTANNLPINGARPSANTYAVDGVGFNDERFDSGVTGAGGAASFTESAPAQISTEAIQEFRIITANADATFGRSSGGQINVITKSGTNRLHGSAYEYLRNDAFDARDFFNNGPFFDSRGRSKTPPFRQHLYGASLGGPIKRDRHFFFGSYEGFYQRRQLTSSLVVPNATLLRAVPGDLGRFLDAFFIERAIVPATGARAGQFQPLAPADRAAAIAAGFPQSLFDGDPANDEAGSALFSIAAKNDITSHGFLIRTDHRLSERLQASVRYAFAAPRQINTSSFDPTESVNRTQSAMLQFIYSASPSQVFEFRGGLLRSRSGDGLEDGVIDPRLSALGLPPNGVGITVSGTNLFPALTLQPVGSRNFQTIPQFFFLHSLNRGALTLRSGLELRDVSVRFRRGFQETPFYDYRGFIGATGLLGASPTQAQAVADSVFGTQLGTNGGPTTSLRGWRSLQQDYFAQADWRLRRDVTLNLGLRYSYFGVYREDINAASNLYAVDGAGNVVKNVSPFASGRTQNRMVALSDDLPFYQPDHNNFQPRAGAAWDIGGRGQTVIRAAYGLFTDRIFQGQFALNVGNIPYATSSFVFARPFLLGPSFPVNPSTPSIWAVDPNIRNSQTHRANVTIEQALGRDTSVSVSYVGSYTNNLIRALEPNGSGTVTQALRPDPRFSDQRFVTNDARARYDSLQIFARRRFTAGLSFTAAYTLAKSEDDVSADALLTARNPSLLNLGASAASGFQGGGAQWTRRPRNADFGPSDFDVRHSLSISHLIELPFGHNRRFLANTGRFTNALLGEWSLAGIAVARSGEPFTITLGRDVNDDGDVSRDRPALLGGSLDDLFNRDRNAGAGRTQVLIPQAEANARLGAPTDVTNPSLAIGRNSLRSPRLRFYDVSLLKRFALGESVALGFEINAFNVFNQVNFAAPVSVLTSTFFGQSTRTRAGANPRQLQFGLKLTF
jgi:hypothetical protein